MNIDDMTCDWLEGRLSEYLEDDLDAETRLRVEKHLAGCDACGSLVMDLRALGVDARVLPDLVPRRDLWDGIASRIEAPVIGIGSAAAMPHSRGGATSRRSWSTRYAMTAAAAGLVAVTAGVTYVATRSMYDGAPAQVAVAPDAATQPAAEREAPSANPTAPAAVAPSTDPDAERAARAGVRAVAEVRDVALTKTAAERTYDVEIARLREIVDTRRSRLDPYTVSVIERSLSVIDQAIAESRAALARDPASGFLTEQLNSALDKKVQLLRTAAMLPART